MNFVEKNIKTNLNVLDFGCGNDKVNYWHR